MYGGAAPVALMPAQHDATKAVYRDWLRAPTGRPVGGSVDWTSVTSPDVHELSERTFDAAGVSSGVRNDYYSQFNSYLYGLG